jgi:putative radical SAM enzyme (TIGR03279 family)
VIRSIDPGSPLSGRSDVGDRLLSINGKRILDVLDYKFYAYDRDLHLLLQRPDGTEYRLHIRKPEGGDLGLDFESYLMDRPRACANRCVFCFIDQLPKGMRPTMYFKDDDARLSFLLGNYITLTNLSPREIDRIIALHVSPVNVSVHTMNPELRVKMLRNPRAGESIRTMRRLAEAGIVMNCQIVCCPGLNDGGELDYSMRELAALYPAVHSVSVVPVGLTRFREGLYPLRPFTPELAARTLDQVTAFGDRCLKELGTRLFFCGDELYLKAGRELPPDEFYEEYTQLENGIGMLRLLETEFSAALRLSDDPGPQRCSIAAGLAAAPWLRMLMDRAAARYPALQVRVWPIVNDFFGHQITVSGLVTGQDLIRQLRGKELGDRLLISQNMLRRQERDFLDDTTLAEAQEALGVPVVPVESDGFQLWDAVCGLPPESSAPVPPEQTENTEYYRYNPSR